VILDWPAVEPHLWANAHFMAGLRQRRHAHIIDAAMPAPGLFLRRRWPQPAQRDPTVYSTSARTLTMLITCAPRDDEPAAEFFSEVKFAMPTSYWAAPRLRRISGMRWKN